MKLIQRVFLLLFFLLPSFIYSQIPNEKLRYLKWSYDNEVYGIIHIRYLKASEHIQGHHVKRGRISFFDNDSLASFDVADHYTFYGMTIPKKSHVSLYPSGKPEFIYLTQNTKVQSYNISSKKRMLHWHLSFYNNGRLRSFAPAQNIIFNSLECSTSDLIHLYPDGKLMGCQLAKSVKIKGTSINAGSKIILNEASDVFPYSITLHQEFNNNALIKRLTVRKYSKLEQIQ